MMLSQSVQDDDDDASDFVVDLTLVKHATLGYGRGILGVESLEMTVSGIFIR